MPFSLAISVFMSHSVQVMACFADCYNGLQTELFEDGCCEFEAINDYIAAHNTFLPYCNHTLKTQKYGEALLFAPDLSLAYPSVKRDKLRLNIRKLLKDDIQFGLKHSWECLVSQLDI